MTENKFVIRPLEWEVNLNKTLWIAKPMRGVQYQVGWVGLEPERTYRWVRVDRRADGYCATVEEGKQLAEKNWREYIKQALRAAQAEPQPSVSQLCSLCVAAGRVYCPPEHQQALAPERAEKEK